MFEGKNLFDVCNNRKVCERIKVYILVKLIEKFLIFVVILFFIVDII